MVSLVRAGILATHHHLPGGWPVSVHSKYSTDTSSYSFIEQVFIECLLYSNSIQGALDTSVQKTEMPVFMELKWKTNNKH